MKILVGGDSVPYGYGFPLVSAEPAIWPNQVANALGAELTNVSVPGYDNTGIFLNILTALSKQKYDLILFQVTNLSRVVLSPNMQGRITLNPQAKGCISEFWSKLLSDKEYDSFYRTFAKVNGDFEHWERFVKMINLTQDLVKQGHNIKFINGLIYWTEDLFKTKNSMFAKELLGYHDLPDDVIAQGLETIHHQTQNINLDLWINPFIPLIKLKVDQASDTDFHPGPISHNIYTELILNHI